ncbi:MAG TPA: ribosome silencing factor [Firmicutes bacterium]|nr:ribosome silencing factor [Bacillota bacterium]
MRKMAKEAKNKKELNTDDELVLQWDEIPPEVRAGVDALQDKKVEGLRVYDLRSFTPFCDFVILCTVMSPAQAKVAKESFIMSMEAEGCRLWGIEGGEDSGWMLVDFWDAVVHIFKPETRRYYNLEALWADLPWWPGEPGV